MTELKLYGDLGVSTATGWPQTVVQSGGDLPDVNSLIAEILGGASGAGWGSQRSTYAATVILNPEHPNTFTTLFPVLEPMLDSVRIVYGSETALDVSYNVALEIADREAEEGWHTGTGTVTPDYFSSLMQLTRQSLWSGVSTTVGPSSWLTINGLQVSADAPPSSASEATETLEAKFESLADEWTQESEFISVQQKAILLRPYQRIIAMGPEVVPLVLRRLRDQPDHWFWALSVLTDASPDAGATTFEEAREAWLQWGRDLL